MPETNEVEPTSPKKKLIAIASIAAAIVIAGVSIGYSYFMQSPERILSEMFKRMANLRYLEFEAQIKAQFDDLEVSNSPGVMPVPDQNKQAEITLDMSGVSDNDKKEPRSTLFIKAKSATMAPFAMALDTELRTIGNKLYFKLNKDTNLGFFDIQQLAGQWLEIDGPEAHMSKEELAEFKKTEKDMMKRFEKIEKLLENPKIFELTEVMPSETIAGQDMHNYKFKISKKELIGVIRKIMKEFGGPVPSGPELKEFESAFEFIDAPRGQIWIGKRDLMAYKLTLNIVFRDPQSAKPKGRIEMVFNYKNFDKPVKVEAPANATSFSKAMEKLAPSIPGLGPDHKHMPDGVTPIGPDGKPLIFPGDIPPQELMPDDMPFMMPPGEIPDGPPGAVIF